MTPLEIKSLRRRLGMNHNTFARFVGISFGGGSNVRAWEDDPQKSVPGNQTCIIMFMLRGIADALDALSENANIETHSFNNGKVEKILRSLLPSDSNGKAPNQ